MTDQTQAVAGPEVSAVLSGHGTAVVTIDGVPQTIRADDEAGVMRQAIGVVADKARELGETITVQTSDPAHGAGALTVTPDGHVSTESDTAAIPETVTSRRELRTARDFASTKKAAPTGPAEMGGRGFVNRASLGAVKLAPGKLELTRRGYNAAIQRGLLGHKTVAVVNLKGGSTKTTITWLTAATAGRIRGGNILAWDNNENKGTLADRSIRANHDHTAIDLLENIDLFASPENAPHLVNYVRPQGENKFHVLASQDEGSERPVIDGPAFTHLHKALRQFYHLIFVDTGNASNASTWQAAVNEADEIVVVAMNKEDSAKTAASTIDDLVRQGHEAKLSKGIAIITQPREGDPERLKRMTDHLLTYVREVVVIPFDKALDDGDDIVFERLGKGTKEAFTKATAAIVDGL
jgi:MinD-like ATPase involved in chromosome partitioning or flagellar assembly